MGDEELRVAVDAYLGSVTVGAASISVARAIKAIRARVPDATTSDDRLAELVSSMALARGLSVMMDARAGDQ
jgi:hypothetical protein